MVDSDLLGTIVIVGLLEEEVCGELLVLVASKVSLGSLLTAETEAA